MLEICGLQQLSVMDLIEELFNLRLAKATLIKIVGYNKNSEIFYEIGESFDDIWK